jgi:hypothetical protein
MNFHSVGGYVFKSDLLIRYRETLKNVLGEDSDFFYSVDDDIEKKVRNYEAQKDLPFWPDPLQIDTLLDDIGRRLDRASSIREAIIQLEADRLRTALSYAATLEQSQCEHELICAQFPGDTVRSASNAKLQAVKNSITSLESRHSQTGGALNYVERLASLRSELMGILESAYCRSRALAAGYLRCYGEADLLMPAIDASRNFSTFPNARYLDEWRAWYRIISRAIELHGEREITHEFAISLGSEWINEWAEGGGDAPWQDRKTRRPAIVANIVEAVRKGAINIDLNVRSPETGSQERIDPLSLLYMKRLRGFGISISMPIDQERSWDFMAQITFGNGPTILLSGLGREPVWATPRTIFNRFAHDNWTIRFLPNPQLYGRNDGFRLSPQNWPIQDIYLHLRAVS